MAMLPDGWARLSPLDQADSIEEMRRQRDLYRDIAESYLVQEWSNLKSEDFAFHPDSQARVDAIIAELETDLPQ